MKKKPSKAPRRPAPKVNVRGEKTAVRTENAPRSFEPSIESRVHPFLVPTSYSIASHININVKLLFKREELTKIKAMQNLIELAKNETSREEFWDALQFKFHLIYAHICQESSPILREKAQSLLSIFVRWYKGELPSMGDMIGHWLSSLFDMDHSVANAASSTFIFKFSSAAERRHLFKVHKAEINDYLCAIFKDALVETLSKSPNKDECSPGEQSVYSRLMILSYLLENNHMDIVDVKTLESYTNERAVASLLDSHSYYIRRALYKFAGLQISVSEDASMTCYLARIIEYIFQKESSSMTCKELVQLLIRTSKAYPDMWLRTSGSKHQVVLDLFWHWLQKKCNDMLVDVLSDLPLILEAMPSATISTEEFSGQLFSTLAAISCDFLQTRHYETAANVYNDCWKVVFKGFTREQLASPWITRCYIELFQQLTFDNGPAPLKGVYMDTLIQFYSSCVLKLYHEQCPAIYATLVTEYTKRYLYPILCSTDQLMKLYYKYYFEGMLKVSQFDGPSTKAVIKHMMLEWHRHKNGVPLSFLKRLIPRMEQDLQSDAFDLLSHIIINSMEHQYNTSDLADVIIELSHLRSAFIDVILDELNVDRVLALERYIELLASMQSKMQNKDSSLQFTHFKRWVLDPISRGMTEDCLLDEFSSRALLGFTNDWLLCKEKSEETIGFFDLVVKKLQNLLTLDEESRFGEKVALFYSLLQAKNFAKFISGHDHQLEFFSMLLILYQSLKSDKDRKRVDILSFFFSELKKRPWYFTDTVTFVARITDYFISSHPMDPVSQAKRAFAVLMDYQMLGDLDPPVVYSADLLCSLMAAHHMTGLSLDTVAVQSLVRQEAYFGDQMFMWLEDEAFIICKEETAIARYIFIMGFIAIICNHYQLFADVSHSISSKATLLVSLEQFHLYLFSIKEMSIVFPYEDLLNLTSLILVRFWRAFKAAIAAAMDTLEIDIGIENSKWMSQQIVERYAHQKGIQMLLSLIFVCLDLCNFDLLDKIFKIVPRGLVHFNCADLKIILDSLDMSKQATKRTFLMLHAFRHNEAEKELDASFIEKIARSIEAKVKQASPKRDDLVKIYHCILSCRMLLASSVLSPSNILSLLGLVRSSLMAFSINFQESASHGLFIMAELFRLLNMFIHEAHMDEDATVVALNLVTSMVEHHQTMTRSYISHVHDQTVPHKLANLSLEPAKDAQGARIWAGTYFIHHLNEFYSKCGIEYLTYLKAFVDSYGPLDLAGNDYWVVSTDFVSVISKLSAANLIQREHLLNSVLDFPCKGISCWKSIMQCQLKLLSAFENKCNQRNVLKWPGIDFIIVDVSASESACLFIIEKAMLVSTSHVASHLIAWKIFIDCRIAAKGNVFLADHLCSVLKDDKMQKLASFMALFLPLFGELKLIEVLSIYDWDRYDIECKPTAKDGALSGVVLFLSYLSLVMNHGSLDDALKLLWLHIFYCLLEHFPSIISSWWKHCQQRRLSLDIQKLTKEHFSPNLIYQQISLIHACSAKELAPMKIKTLRSRHKVSIQAAIPIEETQLEMIIHIPSNYPLEPLHIEGGSRVGVSESLWRKWLFSSQACLNSQNGNLVDGLLLWKKNSLKRFEGVEECAICYSVLQPVDLSLPNQLCKTCKHKFHGACLFKWFKSSGNSTCPMCRSFI